MNEIAFVTTCKGRLHHIKECLPLIVAQSPAEIVVVDYGCPDKVGDWIESNFPEVKVVRIEDDTGFCLPRARNIGAQNTESPWICFVDADIRTRNDWVDWMKQNLDPSFFYRAALKDGYRDLETYGTVICPRKAFTSIDGYDEVFSGWGGEDDDLYTRLSALGGVAEATYPHVFVEPIHHDDAERTLFHDIKNKKLQGLINTAYIETKKYLFSIGIENISIENRKLMANKIKTKLSSHGNNIPKTFSIDLGKYEFKSEDKPISIKIEKKRRFILFGQRKLKVFAN